MVSYTIVKNHLGEIGKILTGAYLLRRTLSFYRETFVNYRTALIRVLFGLYPITGLTREDNRTVKISTPSEAYLYSRGLKDVVVDEAIDTISFGFLGKSLRFVGATKNGDLGASFREYRSLHVKGKTVLDIGASIGDSAVYFAHR